MQKIAAAKPLPYLQFYTDHLDESDRLDGLNTFSRGLYAYQPCAINGTAPSLNIDAWSLDDIAAAAISYGPATVREPSKFDQDFEDMLFLRRVKSGHLRIENGDEVHEFGPGDVFLMQPHHTLHALDDGSALSLRLPFNRLKYDPLANPTVTGLDRNTWQTKVLLSALDTLFDTLPHMCTDSGSQVAEQLSGMIRAAMQTETITEEAQSNRTATMRRYIIANLARDDLGVSHLQSEFNASRATVYRAFEEVGGVARFVREQRLKAIHRDLRNARPSRGAIGQVAGRYGLWDQAGFLRMFRSHYGVRPSDVLGTAHLTHTCVETPPEFVRMPSLASFWSRQ